MQGWGASEKWTAHKANEVVEYIRADAPELWERPPLDEVNVLNGILDLRTRKLRDHDPGFLSTVRIPVQYDREAGCPAWDKFVSEVFPDDARELAYELAADLITPSRSSQKAILLLLGEGSNGKSTYLRALTAFIGSTNAAGVSLHKLESDRFATARLVGKLANICPDLPSTHLTETSVFKAIVGGDDLHGEYKYGESFEFQPYCRLVFSANQVPRSGDASHAFFRRWLVVPFNQTFEASEQVPRETLDARLADPTELSGVLNKALAVMKRVRTKGFTESESMREAWEEFKTMTDPVSVWLDKHTVTESAAWCTKAWLHTEYNKSVDDEGRAGMTANAFGRALKRARPGIDQAQRTVGGKEKVWCWLGIGPRSTDGPPDGGPPSGGPPDGSHDSHDSLDSTNCFLPDGGELKSNNRGKRVNGVNGVNDESVVVEPQPDNDSSSLAETARVLPDATMAKSDAATVRPPRPASGENASAPLSAEEVERYKQLKQEYELLGLRGSIANAKARQKVMSERKTPPLPKGFAQRGPGGNAS